MNPPRRPRRGGQMERALYGWHRHAACQGEDPGLFVGPEGERQPERRRIRRAEGVAS